MTSEMMPCPLSECPPGLFWFAGTLGMKTEYSTESKSHPGYFQCDAYVVASGEYFWGGASDPRERGKLMVTPIDYEAALAAWNTRAPAPAGELAALAEAWVAAAELAQSALESGGDKLMSASRTSAHAELSFHAALSAHRAEVREVITASSDLISGMETLGISGSLPGPVDRLRRRAAALHGKMEG